MFRKKRQALLVDATDEHRDWNLIQHLLADSFAEQKRARRWGVVFKSLTFLYLFAIMFAIYLGAQQGGAVSSHQPHVAVVRVDGVISAEGENNAAKINQALRNAFDNDSCRAVVMAINSPGGSPVQSGYIYDELVRLKELHPNVPVYAVIADIGASGGYYIASAADKIYADKASLVGSIGVTASGFGFVEALSKLGVERRHYTSGEHKAFLDPFSPIKEDEKLFWQDVLTGVHQQFIQAVKQGRGDRVKLTEQLTSGLVWSGEQAMQLGLIDGLASVRSLARDVVGLEELQDYTLREPPLQKMLREFGVAIGRGLALNLAAPQAPQLQ